MHILFYDCLQSRQELVRATGKSLVLRIIPSFKSFFIVSAINFLFAKECLRDFVIIGLQSLAKCSNNRGTTFVLIHFCALIHNEGLGPPKLNRT